MKTSTNKKINIFILCMILIVGLFGYIVLRNPKSTYAVEEETPNTFDDVESVVMSVVKPTDYCNKFSISAPDGTTNLNLGTKSKFHIYGADSQCEGDDAEYVSYCFDPQLSGPPDGSEFTDYSNPREIDPKDSGVVGTFDTGLVYLYQNAYPNWNYNAYPGITDENVQYSITNAVARLLVFHAGFTSNEESDGDKYKVYKYTSYYFDHGTCDGSDNKQECESLRWKDTNNPDVYNIIKDLYGKAKNATINDIWVHNLKLDERVTVSKTKVEETGEFTKTVKGTLSGLSSFNGENPNKSYVKNLRVTCSDGVKCEIFDEAGQKIDANTLLNKLGRDELKYTVVISGNLANVKTDSVEVKVDVDYFDNRDYGTAMVVYSSSGNVTNVQRMLLFAKDTERGLEQTLKVSLCDIDISKFKDVEPVEKFYFNYCDKACYISDTLTPGTADFDEDDFKTNCCSTISASDPDYAKYCTFDCLNTYFPNTCDESSDKVEAHIIEGVEKETGRINYDYCVIDKDLSAVQEAPKKDLAGNDFALATGNVDLSNNRYCSVACIESWEFVLPGALVGGKNTIKAGTYFPISAQMKGTRTCVSNDIRYGSQGGQYKSGYFLYDLDNLNKQIVDAYNDWTYWDEAVKAEEKTGDEMVCSSYSSTTCTGCGGRNQRACPSCCSGPSTANKMNQKKKEWEAEQYRYVASASNPGNGRVEKIANKKGNAAIGKWNSTRGNCSNSCTWDAESWDYLTANRNSAKALYDSLVAEREQIIQEIQNCSSWENNYNFDPKLSYTYEEDYYMSKFVKNNNYFIAQVEDSELDAESDPPLYCQNSYADDYYECSGTATSQTETKIEVTCSIGSGCSETSVTVPKNQNIKLTSAKEALYKPYVVYYAVHPNSDIDGKALDLKDDKLTTGSVTRLGRVMPLRITTPKGIYEYAFGFNQIGQYNDSDKDLGRLMNYTGGLTLPNGSELNVNSSFISSRPSVYNTLDLKPTYECKYEVYEDVCHCCGNDGLNTGSGGSGSSSGNVHSWGFDAEGHLTFYYRPVSLTDPFPNSTNSGLSTSRDLPDNWSTDKGKLVYNRITSEGEFAYEEPEYSYVLTPTGMANIREYNRQQESNEGFNDFTLTCNEYGYDCVSTFLNNLDEIVGYDATKARKTDFEHYEEDALRYDEGRLPTGLGPSMK